jgi:hypothetical protein
MGAECAGSCSTARRQPGPRAGGVAGFLVALGGAAVLGVPGSAAPGNAVPAPGQPLVGPVGQPLHSGAGQQCGAAAAGGARLRLALGGELIEHATDLLLAVVAGRP